MYASLHVKISFIRVKKRPGTVRYPANLLQRRPGIGPCYYIDAGKQPSYDMW